MERTLSYHQLREVLALSGCALCRLRAKSAERFVDSLLWESVLDPGTRQQIRQARGFCLEHAPLFLRSGAALGTAILTHDVLSDLTKLLDTVGYQARPAVSLRRVWEVLFPRQPASATARLVTRLAPQTPCPVCKHVESMEQVYLTTLLDALGADEEMAALLQGSGGLCLPHLRSALTLVRRESVYRSLMTAQRLAWERLAGELSEFIRKQDYRFRDEPWGEEGNAWLRAVAALVGGEGEGKRE
jgi:hypothetical protein